MYEVLKSIVGDQFVLTENLESLYPCPSQARRKIKAVVRPFKVVEIQELVKFALARNIALYPISTGRNWGYGAGIPVVNDCIVLDLSRMNQILDFDSQLGLIKVQPGVSQGQLYEFLLKNNYPFYVPVTGSSPHCSLIGNALERGYGVAPITDHFLGVHSLKAVMPSGELFENLLSEASDKVDADAYTKWGSGPYFDGLFSQGNFGIVTEASIKLVRKASNCAMLAFESKPELFNDTVRATQLLMSTHPGIIQSVKFLSRNYLVALNKPYPVEEAARPDFSVAKWLELKANEMGWPKWQGLIFIFGTKATLRATLKDCKEALKPYVRNIKVIDNSFVSLIKRVKGIIPAVGIFKKIREQSESIIASYELMQGKPQEKFLSPAYWRTGKLLPRKDPNPGKDGCGLLWFAPYVPFCGSDINNIESIFERLSRKYNFAATCSLTTITHSAMSGLLPILFDPSTELERAIEFHRALFEECSRHGYLPYRTTVDSMNWYAKTDHSHFFETLQKIKENTDSDKIIAPGRYDGLEDRRTDV